MRARRSGRYYKSQVIQRDCARWLLLHNGFKQEGVSGYTSYDWVWKPGNDGDSGGKKAAMLLLQTAKCISRGPVRKNQQTNITTTDITSTDTIDDDNNYDYNSNHSTQYRNWVRPQKREEGWTQVTRDRKKKFPLKEQIKEATTVTPEKKNTQINQRYQ